MRADNVVIKRRLGQGSYKRAYAADVFDHEREECRREVMLASRGGACYEELIYDATQSASRLSVDDRVHRYGCKVLRKEQLLLECLAGIDGVPQLRPYSSPARLFMPYETEWTLHDHIGGFRNEAYQGGGDALWRYARDIVRVGCDVASTLEQMASRGVVAHADIKPSNILVLHKLLDDPECSIRIIDYGSVVFGDFRWFPKDSIITTDGYAPPEFYSHWPHTGDHKRARKFVRPDKKSDVYMLGMTLYESLVPGVDFAMVDVFDPDFFFLMVMPSVHRNYAAIGMSSDIDEIIVNMIRWSPKDRWSMTQALDRLENLYVQMFR
ncbi:hypothetical protein HY641_02115 [Candidatus Woesearchaeota archaeon]|nr:hypothetical protein [Candidatus Woesearchaeota archaeon]